MCRSELISANYGTALDVYEVRILGTDPTLRSGGDVGICGAGQIRTPETHLNRDKACKITPLTSMQPGNGLCSQEHPKIGHMHGARGGGIRPAPGAEDPRPTMARCHA